MFLACVAVSTPDAKSMAFALPVIASVILAFAGIRYEMPPLIFLKAGRRMSYIIGSVGLALIAVASVYPASAFIGIENKEIIQLDFLTVAMGFGFIALSGFVVDPIITLLENKNDCEDH